MSLRPDYDDMRDFQYAEEHPGYQREIAYTPDTSDPDYDPEIEAMVVDIYAHDNAKRRENNLRTENATLRALLTQHDIEIPEEN